MKKWIFTPVYRADCSSDQLRWVCFVMLTADRSRKEKVLYFAKVILKWGKAEREPESLPTADISQSLTWIQTLTLILRALQHKRFCGQTQASKTPKSLCWLWTHHLINHHCRWKSIWCESGKDAQGQRNVLKFNFYIQSCLPTSSFFDSLSKK